MTRKENKIIKNLNKLCQVRRKLGKTITKDCLTYFTKCNMKQLYEEGLITKTKSHINNYDKKIVIEDVPCITFTDKFDKVFRKYYSGNSRSYGSCSDIHDISLSYNVYHFAKENNLKIEDYTAENELPVMEGYSRPDGTFNLGGGTVVAIEQTTKHYTSDMKRSKEVYCSKYNMQIKFY